MEQFFDFSEEVLDALNNNQPVLALESTLISHGLPYPQNLEIANEVEEISRKHGAVPATIAILGGKIKIGLAADELEFLAVNKNILKVSVRDIPYALSQRLPGGTTVAATIFCAAKVGIQVMATGGIGGVHRGEEQDISADLIELATTPIAVVCAGAKSILDLPRTLEFLETYSVPVVGYKTDYFPAFYTAASAHRLAINLSDTAALAELLKTHWEIGLASGILIANPVPEEKQLSNDIIEPIIKDALVEAEKNQIRGKAVTPFLLQRIAEMTQGKSIEVNLDLIRNNVKVGAEVAAMVSQVHAGVVS